MKPAMHPDERDEVLERMGRLARSAFSDATKPVASAAGKRQLKAALATEKPRRHASRWAALAAAALVAVAALFVYRGVPRPLSYEIAGASPNDGGYLQGSKSRPAIAHFTDGTEVRVNTGARARIVDVDARGARVALEQGRVHLRVVHRPEARWSVEAGPFSIAVTGTEFDAEWSAADGVLVVEMRSGAVIVRGPLATDGIGVHGGQRLIASVPDGRLHIEPVGAARATMAAPGPSPRAARSEAETAQRERAPAAPSSETQIAEAQNEDRESAEEARALRGRPPRGEHEDRRARARGTGAATPSRDDARGETSARHGDETQRDENKGAQDDAPPTSPSNPPADSANADAEHPPQPAVTSWAKRVASGDFRGVIADAESRGLSTTMAEAPLGDLVALADAARYTGSSSIARDALVSQRKRYPSSADAKNAAFLLGRIAEDRGATGEAIDWYERYLSEAPRGAFAAEALGREMLAQSRAGSATAAAVVARRYLERFPGGPYADRARKLAAAP